MKIGDLAKEVSKLQKIVLDQGEEIKDLKAEMAKLQLDVQANVVSLKATAKDVLVKAEALVNPYSSHTMTMGQK